MPLYPFSFEETLRHQGQAIPDDAAFVSSADRSRLERAFLDGPAVAGAASSGQCRELI